MTGDEHRESQQFVNRIFAIPLSKSGLTRVTPNGNSHHYIQRLLMASDIEIIVALMCSMSVRHPRFDVGLCRFPRLWLSEVFQN